MSQLPKCQKDRFTPDQDAFDTLLQETLWWLLQIHIFHIYVYIWIIEIKSQNNNVVLVWGATSSDYIVLWFYCFHHKQIAFLHPTHLPPTFCSLKNFDNWILAIIFIVVQKTFPDFTGMNYSLFLVRHNEFVLANCFSLPEKVCFVFFFLFPFFANS